MNLEPLYQEMTNGSLELKNKFLNYHFYDGYRSRLMENLDAGKRTRLRRKFTNQEANLLLDEIFHGRRDGLRNGWPYNTDEDINKFLYGTRGRRQNRRKGRIGRNWIQKAIKRPGEFTEKAEKHGLTAQQFAREVRAHPDDYDTRTKRQANLALTLGKMARRRRR